MDIDMRQTAQRTCNKPPLPGLDVLARIEEFQEVVEADHLDVVEAVEERPAEHARRGHDEGGGGPPERAGLPRLGICDRHGG